MRRYAYLDHIRWMTVLLVIVYHVCYLFNGVGIFGGVPNARNLPFLDTISGTVYPWFMVLLFVVAGMCARFALVQQGNRAFLRNRARKLLVPSTLGLFVLHWVTGYLNIRMGGAVDTIPKPLLYPISVLSGIGPLWFVQLLFLFSAILVLIRRIDRNGHLFRLGERTPSWLICAFALLIWGAAQVGNMPVITTYRLGIYLTAFLLGYAVFAHEAVMARVERMRWGTLAAAVIGAAAYGVWTNGQNFTDAAISAKPVGECVPVGGGAGGAGQCAPLSPSGDSGLALFHPAELRAVSRALPRTAADGESADRADDASGSADVFAHAGDWLRRDAGTVGDYPPDSGDSMAGAGHPEGEKGMNVYESIPTMEKGEIRLRPVTAEDEAALLRVYGDPLALPFFNSDNCHGDIFYYDTPEKMRRAMDFWRTSWEQGWFVRWAIALRSEVIGTVELCRRGESPDDPYSGMGILRVDVGSAWEKSDVLAAVMDALLPDAYALLNCRTLMTKAAPYAVARVATLTECGFVRSDKPVMGQHGERVEYYWVREK